MDNEVVIQCWDVPVFSLLFPHFSLGLFVFLPKEKGKGIGKRENRNIPALRGALEISPSLPFRFRLFYFRKRGSEGDISMRPLTTSQRKLNENKKPFSLCLWSCHRRSHGYISRALALFIFFFFFFIFLSFSHILRSLGLKERKKIKIKKKIKKKG